MSWTHCAWASKQTAGSAINKLVLMMMADATSYDNPLLILRIKTLAEKCETSDSSVKRAIKDLEDLGLLICVERFFENTQQSNAYILMTDAIDPKDAERIAKENERSGCFFKIRGGGGCHTEPRVGSQGTQGGVTVTPRTTPSSSLPSSLEPISSFASLTGGVEQQSEVSKRLSEVAEDQRAVLHNPIALYNLYPRKVGRAAALKAIERAVKKDGWGPVKDAVEEYARCTSQWPESERDYIPHPATWFNGARYLDDRSEWTRKIVKQKSHSRFRPA